MVEETNKRPTQASLVLKYLKDFGIITQYEAFIELGIMRLASRISELKKCGHKIEREFVTVQNRYGQKCSVCKYKLIEKDKK